MAFSSFNTLNQLTNKKNVAPSRLLTTGPIIYFPFEGNITNSGTSSYTTAQGGTITYSTATYKKGTRSMSVNNGIGNGNYMTFNSGSLTPPFTISLWTYPTTINSSGNSRMYEVGNLFVLYNSGTDTAFFIGGTPYSLRPPMTANNWYHWTVVFTNATTATFYLNGSPKIPNGMSSATQTIGTLSVSNSTFYVGRGSNTDAGYTGQIDEFRIYNYALTSSEVSDLYTQTAGILP